MGIRKKKKLARKTTPAATVTERRAGSFWSVWAWLLLPLATLLLFWKATTFGFVPFDDNDYVYQNEVVLRGLSADGIRWAFAGAHYSNWHPLTWMSHMLDVELFGLNPGRHHLISVLIHVCASLLLYLALMRMTRAVPESLAVAALFALHPLHVESVAWIAERKDVLCGLFWMAALWGYTRYARRPSVAAYSAVMVFFIAALLSKPMAVTFPFVLLLLDFWPLRRSERPLRLIVEKIPLILLAIAASIGTFLVQREAAVETLEALPFSERLANAVLSYGRYIGKTLWPVSLAVYYPYPTSFNPALIAVCVALLVAVTFVTIRQRDKRPYLLVGWLWYLGTLIPVIGLVQVGTQAYADRYSYLPLIGIFVIVVWGVAEAVSRLRIPQSITTPLGLTLLFLLGGATSRQLGHWRDGETLFRRAVSVTEPNRVAHANLGMALVEKGRHQEAVEHFAEAVRLDPSFVKARINLGNAYARTGRLAEAVAEYQRVLEADPTLSDVRNNLGVAYWLTGRPEEARQQLLLTVQNDPDFVPAVLSLARFSAGQGNVAEARRMYQRALEIDPRNEEALRELGRIEAAQ